MLKPSFLVSAFVLILGSGVQAGVDPSLVGWWQFEEGSGTTVNDSSGKDHHGAIQGTPEWGPGPEGFGSAVGFSNTQGAYCGIFDPTGGTGTFTMALWCNWDGTQSIQHFVTKSNGWGADTAMFQIEVKGGHADPARVDRLHIAYQAAPQAVLNLVPHNEWVHLALVFDGTHATGYRNGVDDVGPQPTGIGPNVDAPIIVGASHAAEGRTFQGFLDDVRLYSRTLTAAEVQALMSPVPPGAASEPSPPDQATDAPRAVSLEWTAGEFAATHDVYLGTVFEDVNAAGRSDPRDVLVSEGQTDTSYDAGHLEFGQTYYWRIDEVNAAPDNAIYKGSVWSFTVEPFAYPIENVMASSNGSSDAPAGPERTVDGSGLNAEGEHSVDADDMWLAVPGAEPLWIEFAFGRVYKLHEMMVWNYNVMFELVLGFGLKDVTVEHSTDGVDWTVLGDAELAQGTALPDYTANTTVEFGGVAAKFVRLTVNSGHGPMGQFGLSEV
ncbi:MAG: LamG-like jellyroll fold domain-containing protein, partial [Planctomycetota bacterium]